VVAKATFQMLSLDCETALTLLESHREQGLSNTQVQERAAQFGPNELEEKAGRSSWRILLDQFSNIMLIMLLAVAVVSALLGEAKDAITILVIVSLNGLLGYVQESRAEKALAALKKMATPIVRVQRQGGVQEIPGRELVPGDIVLLEAGKQVPADGRTSRLHQHSPIHQVHPGVQYWRSTHHCCCANSAVWGRRTPSAAADSVDEPSH
jgi:Ca2+-transporting ATPase